MPRLVVIGLISAVGFSACVEQAFDYWQTHQDAGVGPDAGEDSGSAVDGGVDAGGVADAGEEGDGGGGADGGVDAGGAADGGGGGDAGSADSGPPACDAGCTSDWPTFLACGPSGQTLCIPSTLATATVLAVHGPASGYEGSALAYANWSTVGVGVTSADGGVIIQRQWDFPGETVASLAVADNHDYSSGYPDCADAIFTFTDGDGGYLLSCDPLSATSGVDAGGLLNALPVNARGMSWVPNQNNRIQALAVASNSASTGAGFYFEGTPADKNQQVIPWVVALEIEGVPFSPRPHSLCGGPAGGSPSWWVFVSPASFPFKLEAVDYCLQSQTLDVPLVPQRNFQLAATAGGGVVGVGTVPDSGTDDLVGFYVDPRFDAGVSYSTNLSAPSQVHGVHLTRWSGATVRVTFLTTNNLPYFADLNVDEDAGTIAWQAAGARLAATTPLIFAAPMVPNMLLRQDGTGIVSIGYLP